MNEQQMMDLIRPVLTDQRPLTISLTVFHAWTLHSALTVVGRHPAVSQAQKTIWRDIAWRLKKAIVARHPEAQAAFKSDNQAEFVAMSYRAISDEAPLDLALSVAKVWFLVAALQLVTRHSGVAAEMNRRLRSLGMEFQQRLEDLHPDATVILNMGWNSEYDVEGGR